MNHDFNDTHDITTDEPDWEPLYNPDQRVFTIPAFNMNKLQSKFEKLNKRATAIGCPPVELKVLREFTKPAPGYEQRAEIEGADRVPQAKYFEVEVVGEGPKIEGWKFVGTLDHCTVPGSVIVKTVPGEAVPQQFYHNDAVCDHCNRIRRRVETFVLQHDDGHHTQVGRQCLKDFLGHDPKRIAAFLTRVFDLLDDAESEDGFGGGGGFADYMFDSDEVLAVTAAVVNDRGWVPRSTPDDRLFPTANLVKLVFMPPKMGTRERADHRRWVESLDLKNERWMDEAKDAREWLVEQEPNNEYMHNLHAINKGELVSARMFGFWCSLIAAFRRSQERLETQKAERAKMLNEYVGNVKDRIELPITVVSIKHFNGPFGVVHLVRMLDEKNRTLVWFANTEVEMEIGKEYTIKGTVKKHEEYKNWKQTTLNRVKVL